MIQALKNPGLWGYINGSITTLLLLALRRKELTIITKVIQETQDKIDVWVKNNGYALGKMG